MLPHSTSQVLRDIIQVIGSRFAIQIPLRRPPQRFGVGQNETPAGPSIVIRLGHSLVWSGGMRPLETAVAAALARSVTLSLR